ncbi:protein-disulfide reductase DsbD family protein [Frigidibacter sp. RF13]|uniref:protein-disulfide reductase DsbD domain-containing protein n=1 Tax=Frigidibacter sp. RF13 TaxID=2997340 RepID=UPI002271C24C|nr:protein-disulfide reductase DsbD domain-containing protein [Frigidibacter sp. RF13]MCY1127718.1 protein-disulfide reductase DsbD family protein [Frigidibacter sp. RF13]
MHSVVLFIAAALSGGPSAAQNLPDDLIRAEILPGWQTEDGTRMAALHLTFAPGWKTYWRSPGEAGIPPEFDWSASQNVGSVRLHWPRPQVYEISGYRTLVYPDELVLPVEIIAAAPGQPVTLSASVNLGVCDEICVPVSFSVSADLSGTSAPDPAIRAALAQMPEDAARRGLAAARCTAEPIRDGMRLTADIPFPAPAQDSFAVVELDDRAVWVAPVETRVGGQGMVQVSDLVPANAKPFALSRSAVRLTVFSGGDVVEFDGCKG